MLGTKRDSPKNAHRPSAGVGHDARDRMQTGALGPEHLGMLRNEQYKAKTGMKTQMNQPDAGSPLSEQLHRQPPFSYNIVKDPVHIRDFHATVLHLLGFDHQRFSLKYQGLDQRLTGVEPARVVKELLA
jgi:hypothetical protein